MYAELDVLNAQVQKNRATRDAAEASINDLATQLVEAKGNLPKEKELSDKIHALVELLSVNEDTAKIAQLTKDLSESETKIRSATTTHKKKT